MKKFLLAFVLGAMLSGGFTYMTVSASPEIYEKQVVTVHTGDTLWDIAAAGRYGPYRRYPVGYCGGLERQRGRHP